MKLWYAARVENGTNRYRAVEGKPVMVEQSVISEVKESRQPQYKKRLTGTLDHDGDPVYEFVPVAVAVTAQGRERRRAVTGGNMPVGPSSGFAGDQARYVHNYHLEFINKAMLMVSRVSRASYAALEMDAAGYSIEAIADELSCGRDMARSYLDEGIASLITIFLIRPWSLTDAN